MWTLPSLLVLWLAGSSFFAAASPAAVDPEMVRWAEARVPAGLPVAQRLTLLHRALVDRGGLAIADSSRTMTARQAFAERKANCVAFAHLYLALARRLGMPVYFVLARGIEREGRQKDLRVLEGHMAVGFGGGDGDPAGAARALVVDASGVRRAGRETFEKIGDLIAEAIFFSNRGVEALLDGHRQEAVAWLQKATDQAPELAPLWSNLGVARRRAGDLPGAAFALAEARRLGGPSPAKTRAR